MTSQKGNTSSAKSHKILQLFTFWGFPSLILRSNSQFFSQNNPDFSKIGPKLYHFDFVPFFTLYWFYKARKGKCDFPDDYNLKSYKVINKVFVYYSKKYIF